MHAQEVGKQEEAPIPRLAGPPALALDATHPCGPLASRSGHAIETLPLCFPLVNISTGAGTGTLTLDPLVREKDGASIAASLALAQDGTVLFEGAGTTSVPFAPGAALRLRLQARGQLPPGRYLSRLRVSCPGDEQPLDMPITVRVTAHLLWAIGLMLLGLMCLGAVLLLAEAAGMFDMRANILTQRQEFHEFLDRFPPAEPYQPLVAEVEDRFGIALEVQNLHPAWGPGVTLAIDFGDKTPLVYKTAEEVRQGAPLPHRYKRSERVTVQIVAAEHFSAGSLRPAGETLGEGKAEVVIQPSPISLTRRLADHFLTLRFFIALGLGLLVQAWRFYGERPFGAHPKDYIEAFAWGIGIDAGTRGLVDFLGKIGLPH